jgi:glycopeptide antibiotics resistance protein
MIRQLYYHLLVYRSIAFPFLVVSAIAVPCWIAFRLYRARKPGHVLSLSSEGLLLIVVIYLSGLTAATLLPNHNPRLLKTDTTRIELRPNRTTVTCARGAFPTNSTARAFCLYNARGNILLFFPLGILLPLVWRRLSFWKCMQIALALSISIEILQYVSRMWGSFRSADINDVILNLSGAFLGLLLVSLLRLPRSKDPIRET